MAIFCVALDVYIWAAPRQRSRLTMITVNHCDHLDLCAAMCGDGRSCTALVKFSVAMVVWQCTAPMFTLTGIQQLTMISWILVPHSAAMVISVRQWSYPVRQWLFVSAGPILCLFSFAAPGPLPLQLMSRGYVQGQLDTLHQFPEYLEVIKDDGKPLPVADPGQPQAGTSSEGPVSKRTRYGKKKPKTSKIVVQPEEEEQPDPKEHLRGVGQL